MSNNKNGNVFRIGSSVMNYIGPKYDFKNLDDYKKICDVFNITNGYFRTSDEYYNYIKKRGKDLLSSAKPEERTFIEKLIKEMGSRKQDAYMKFRKFRAPRLVTSRATNSFNEDGEWNRYTEKISSFNTKINKYDIHKPTAHIKNVGFGGSQVPSSLYLTEYYNNYEKIGKKRPTKEYLTVRENQLLRKRAEAMDKKEDIEKIIKGYKESIEDLQKQLNNQKGKVESRLEGLYKLYDQINYNISYRSKSESGVELQKIKAEIEQESRGFIGDLSREEKEQKQKEIKLRIAPASTEVQDPVALTDAQPTEFSIAEEAAEKELKKFWVELKKEEKDTKKQAIVQRIADNQSEELLDSVIKYSSAQERLQELYKNKDYPDLEKKIMDGEQIVKWMDQLTTKNGSLDAAAFSQVEAKQNLLQNEVEKLNTEWLECHDIVSQNDQLIEELSATRLGIKNEIDVEEKIIEALNNNANDLERGIEKLRLFADETRQSAELIDAVIAIQNFNESPSNISDIISSTGNYYETDDPDNPGNTIIKLNDRAISDIAKSFIAKVKEMGSAIDKAESIRTKVLRPKKMKYDDLYDKIGAKQQENDNITKKMADIKNVLEDRQENLRSIELIGSFEEEIKKAQHHISKSNKLYKDVKKDANAQIKWTNVLLDNNVRKKQPVRNRRWEKSSFSLY